jgi:hypothetical protein
MLLSDEFTIADCADSSEQTIEDNLEKVRI